jgi:hypothetical protein
MALSATAKEVISTVEHSECFFKKISIVLIYHKSRAQPFLQPLYCLHWNIPHHSELKQTEIQAQAN